MRKLLIVLLTSVLLLSSLGCSRDKGSSNPTNHSNDNSGAQGDIYEIVMQYPTLGKAPQDIKLIENAVNARTEPEIGVRILFSPINVFEMASTTNIMFSWGDKLDIVTCGFGISLADYVNKGILIELDDLVAEYGQSIVKAEGIAMSGGYFRGKLFALPSEEKMGRVRALYCRQDILNKYGIEPVPEKIYSMDEISEIFAKVKAGEDEGFYCLATGLNDEGIYSNFDIVDKLGSTLASGCLTNNGYCTTEIVNYFATDEYEQACRTIRSWRQNGYLNPNCNMNMDPSDVMMQSGDYFAFFNSAEPDMLASQSRMLWGYVDSELVPLYTTSPYTVSQSFLMSMWGITSSCTDPVKAMKWLDLLWRDTEIINLLSYGIEGLHYEFIDSKDLVIRYPEGVNSANTSYISVLQVWGDKSKCYAMAPLNKAYYRALDDFNQSIMPEHTSGALGYCFDASPVKMMYSAVDEVIKRFESSFKLGFLDLDIALPEFRTALDEAGIREVIAENQRQFDSWKAG